AGHQHAVLGEGDQVAAPAEADRVLPGRLVRGQVPALLAGAQVDAGGSARGLTTNDHDVTVDSDVVDVPGGHSLGPLEGRDLPRLGAGLVEGGEDVARSGQHPATSVGDQLLVTQIGLDLPDQSAGGELDREDRSTLLEARCHVADRVVGGHRLDRTTDPLD